MKPILVLDTQIVVRFVLGLHLKLSGKVFHDLVEARARVVIPAYSLQEIQIKFPYSNRKDGDIPIPPTTLMRLVRHCSNARILSRGAAVLVREFELDRMRRLCRINLDSQDIPIAAALLVVRDYSRDAIALVTSDAKLGAWASSMGVPVRRS